MPEKKRAIVLLSGGIDSATVLAIALADGWDVTPLSFDYGQRHFVELAAAQKIAKQFGLNEHFIFPLELNAVGGSVLTNAAEEVPKNRTGGEIGHGIPSTYVPARNTIFLSIALAFAEANQARAIFIGANAIDYSGYPDCRPEFLEAFEYMASLGTKAGAEGHQIKIIAPLLEMSKAAIIHKGVELGVDYSLTFSCYDPDEAGYACGGCDSCLLRHKGFIEAGVPDPTRYRQTPRDI